MLLMSMPKTAIVSIMAKAASGERLFDDAVDVSSDRAKETVDVPSLANSFSV